MSDIETKEELVRVIVNRALLTEKLNLSLPQTQRAKDMDMVHKQMKMLRQELEAEKRNLK